MLIKWRRPGLAHPVAVICQKDCVRRAAFPMCPCLCQCVCLARPTRTGKYAISSHHPHSSGDVSPKSGSPGRGLSLPLCQGDCPREERAGRGAGYVVYPVMADTRTGRCNNKRQQHPPRSERPITACTEVPYQYPNLSPRWPVSPAVQPTPFSYSTTLLLRQNPWCFCPVDPDGQLCPGP